MAHCGEVRGQLVDIGSLLQNGSSRELGLAASILTYLAILPPYFKKYCYISFFWGGD